MKQDISQTFSFFVVISVNFISNTVLVDGFSVIWNVPTFICEDKFGINFNLSRYGIIMNEGDTFRGDKVTIFYRHNLGLYPWIDQDGNFINGGLPQLADLRAHLQQVSSDLDRWIPDYDFNGVAVIDWEEWRPIFVRNGFNEHQRVYMEQSEMLVRQHHPYWSYDKVRRQAEIEFEEAARNFIQATLETCIRMRPRGKWGLYGFPSCYNYKPGQMGCSGDIISENNRLHLLFNTSSALFPSIYLERNFGTHEDRFWHVRGELQESRRVRGLCSRPDTPILPCTRYRYRDTGTFYDNYKSMFHPVTQEILFTKEAYGQVTQHMSMGSWVKGWNDVHHGRSCKDVIYIPDIAKSRVTKHLVKTIQAAITTLQHKTTAIKDRRVENQSRIVKEKDDCINKVLARRKEIDKHLDKIQNEQTTNINDKFNEFNSKLREDIKSCDQSITLLNQSLQNISTSDSKHNTSQTFIHIKQAEQILLKAGEDLKEVDKNMNDSLSFHYKTDTDIDYVFSSRDLFGSLQAGIPTHADLELIEDINIKIDSDTKIDLCDCYDLCQLPDGTIIVTDLNSRNIKSLTYDETYKLNDSLTLSDSPWGVCCTNDNEVAVTVFNDKKVEIVTIKPKMDTKNSFKVDYRCHGIEYNVGKLYIGHGCDKQVAVYDLDGNRLQTYKKGQRDKALFSEPLHLCVIPDKQQIAVADGNKGLVLIDMSGQLVTEYTYADRQWTCGVCIDDRGNLILTDYDSKQIVTVGQDKTCRALITNMDKRLQAVFFDKQNKRLFVIQEHCDFMKVFTVKYTFNSSH